jgi:hypothetical protein
MWTKTRVLCLVTFAACVGALSNTASAEVVAGTVVSVSPRTNRLVIKLRSKETNRALRLSSETRVLIDGKKGFVSRLKPGQSVYAFVSESYVTRLNVKSAVNPTPDPAPKKGTSGSSKTTSKPDKPSTSTPRTTSTTTGSRTPSRSSARSRRFPAIPGEAC